MKFPKEKVRLINLVKTNLEEENYFNIFKLKDELFLSYQELNHTNIYNDLLYATFNLGHFDGVILISDELTKKDYESFEQIYFTLLAYIANNDLYQAMLYIKRSYYLNLDEYKVYHSSDGANYSNILNIEESLIYTSLALIITNFIEGLAKEMLGDVNVDQEYTLYRLFDLVNLIYELGYPLNIITELTRAIKVMFSIEM